MGLLIGLRVYFSSSLFLGQIQSSLNEERQEIASSLRPS